MNEENRLGPSAAALVDDDRESGAPQVLDISPDAIDPNPFQPRIDFKPEALEELADSIARHGILQPLTVRRGRIPDRFELVAGERRLRAAQKIGLPSVPCIVALVPDDRLLELALVENIQRQDLDPIEIANGYRALMERCGYTQQTLAQRLGLGRSTVANAMRLLELPEALRENVSRGTLSAGHARAIAALPGSGAQKALAARVARDSLTVRETEAEVEKLKKPPRPRSKPARPAYLDQLESRLRKVLGTKITIQETGPSRGRIVIDFYGETEFERLLALLE